MKNIRKISTSFAWIVLFFIFCGFKNGDTADSKLPVEPVLTGATVTDVDGNVYDVVEIGNQLWLKENLKVSRYRNGDTIPAGLNTDDWLKTKSGAYAVYENNKDYEVLYGKLYNWYATVDPRGLCPSGWHVPSDDEWAVLTDFLGGKEIAGAKLKEKDTLHWNRPNNGVTNESGFTALPGGLRGFTSSTSGKTIGIYKYIGEGGYWWTTTEQASFSAWYRYLYCYYKDFYRFSYDKSFGFSVRCLKD